MPTLRQAGCALIMAAFMGLPGCSGGDGDGGSGGLDGPGSNYSNPQNASTTIQPGGVTLLVNESACSTGLISMDVMLQVQTDAGLIVRTFTPSCGFTMSEMVMQNDVVCSLSSNMCWANSGSSSQIDVSCRSNNSPYVGDSDSFPCPAPEEN